MSIESINGARKYRLSPLNNRIVQMQPHHKARWIDYREAATVREAWALVIELGRMAREETQEIEPVKE